MSDTPTASNKATRHTHRRGGFISVRTSQVALEILKYLQDALGLSPDHIIEMLLREEGRRRGIPIPGTRANLASGNGSGTGNAGT